MSANAVRSNDATADARAGKVDMKLEVVVIPVSDVDRAKKFYGSLGWRLDATPPGVVQLTPPGSGCSVQFGRPPHDEHRGHGRDLRHRRRPAARRGVSP
jgi:catechol 2,3-dioxygenase-like lactoylglutathione lyase family enzyme